VVFDVAVNAVLPLPYLQLLECKTMDKVQKAHKNSFTYQAAKFTWIQNLHNEHSISITFRQHMQNITSTKTTQ
jgi:hypothetical protein